MKQNTIRKVVIPAAGLGTRFLPMTKAQPKEMLPVVDKPVIQYVVEEAVNSGIDDILIITGRNKRAIEDHFDRSYELESKLRESGNDSLLTTTESLSTLADIHYIRQKEQNGLGSAILRAEKHCNDEAFAVLLGDTITIPDQGSTTCTNQMIQAYAQFEHPVVVVEKVRKDKIQDYGIIDGKMIGEGIYDIQGIVEKPNPAVAPSNLGAIGRYVLTPDIFDIIKSTPPGHAGEVQLTDGLQRLPKKIGLVTRCRRYDIGDKPGWMLSNLELALQHPEYGNELRKYLKSVSEGE
jgi:UTP--glucose-1-phosphate uridylyltransferase